MDLLNTLGPFCTLSLSPSLVAQPLWGPTLGAKHFTLGQHQVTLWWIALTTHTWFPSYLEVTIFCALGDFLPPWRWLTTHRVCTWVPSYHETTSCCALGDILPPWRRFTTHWVSTHCLMCHCQVVPTRTQHKEACHLTITLKMSMSSLSFALLGSHWPSPPPIICTNTSVQVSYSPLWSFLLYWFSFVF